MQEDLRPDQLRLAQRMSELSEEAFHAGWMLGLEHDLWRAVVEGPRKYGRLTIEPSHILELRTLADECSGWIVFDDESGETWVPLAEWEARYDRNRTEPALELRPATLADEPFLRKLHRDAMGPHVEAAWGSWDPDVQAEHFSKAPITDHEIVVLNGTAVGCLLVVRHPDAFELIRIWIAPAEQGRGLGTRLVQQVCQRARQEGFGVRLRVLIGNPAKRLYARCGFVVVEQTATHRSMAGGL